ncbi:MAG: hypothetical protein ACQES8_04635 [Thermodesulfobacteriota bacterium]
MKHSKIALVVIATGISSVVTQLVMIREFLAQFEGNEFLIALILFSWLILGGAGTWLARFSLKWSSPAVGKLALFSTILVALAPLQIMALRLGRDLIFTAGASIGFYPAFEAIIMTIGPYSLLDGFLLPYSLYTLRQSTPDYPGGRIYLMDNLGDVSGGALFSFILVIFTTPLQAVFLANIPLLIFGCLLLSQEKRSKIHGLMLFMAGLLTLTAGCWFEKPSLAPLSGELIDYRESRYGRIKVVRKLGQYTLCMDGAPLYSNQDQAQAEKSIHLPMAQSKHPERVLIIGAQGGMLKEIDKYNLKRVDYLEIDEEITEIQFDYHILTMIDGLKIIHQDGRKFLEKTDNQYDAIIINMPEPDTFQRNRYFTREFFKLIRSHLDPKGIFSFSVSGFDNFLGPPQRKKISSLYNSVLPVFQNVLILPGDKITFLCSSNPLSPDIPQLLAEKGIKAPFLSAYFQGNITKERIRELRGLVVSEVLPNYDMHPYLMRIMFNQWFNKFNTSPTPLFGGLAVIVFIYLVRCRREEIVLFSTGFLTMGCEIIVILVYQILFGYIYEEIGLIVTVFLAGLLPGARLGIYLGQKKQARRYLLTGDACLSLLLLILLLLLAIASRELSPSFFLIFGFLVSLICGCQFPLALNLGGEDNSAAARTFSADLIGAACGTLLTSLVLIPYLGVLWGISGLVLIKLAGTSALMLSEEK